MPQTEMQSEGKLYRTILQTSVKLQQTSSFIRCVWRMQMFVVNTTKKNKTGGKLSKEKKIATEVTEKESRIREESNENQPKTSDKKKNNTKKKH